MGKKKKNKVIFSRTQPITKPKFRSKLNKVVDHLWQIQEQINELKEYKKQWKELSDFTATVIGKRPNFRINNSIVYKDYNWNKYHVVVTNLCSVLSNEYQISQNPESLFSQCIHHLEILPLERYLRKTKSATFVQHGEVKFSKAKRREILRYGRRLDAENLLKAKEAAFDKLFSKKSKKKNISEADVTKLMRKVQSRANEIRSARDFFGHQFEDTAVMRHKRSIRKISIEHLEETCDELFGIISAIGLIFADTTYSKNDLDVSAEVADMIDLILLGTIQYSAYAYAEYDQGRHHFYVDARAACLKSDFVKDLVLNP